MPASRRRLYGGAGLVETEVVELADGRVAGGSHLPVRLDVAAADDLRGLPFGLRSISSRHAQKSPPPARPRSARWNVWLCALTNPGNVSVSAIAVSETILLSWLPAPSPHRLHTCRTRSRSCGWR